MAYVYRHIRLDKNEPFYIGIGSDFKYKRAYENRSRNDYWHKIVNKSKFIVEIMIDDISWDEAKLKEIEFIKLYGRKDLGNGILSNMTDGGDGLINSSEYTRKKMSESSKKENISLETRKRMSDAAKGRVPHNKGKNLYPNVMENLKKINKGKKQSDESNAKRSIAHKGKKLPIWQVELIRNRGIGRIVSQETKDKISKTKTGKKLTKEHINKIQASKGIISDETRKKLSEAARLQWQKVKSENKNKLNG